MKCEPAPLVESASAQGRWVYVVTYREGGSSARPVKSSLLFHSPEEATECARVLREAKKPFAAPVEMEESDDG